MVEKFNSAFPSIVEEILQISPFEGQSAMADVGKKRLKELLEYVSPSVSSFRGYVVPLVFQQFTRDASQKQLHEANVLGWAFQVIQSSYMLCDDIIDGGKFRWGKPCWHRLSASNAMLGVNDCFLLEHAAYSLLRKYFALDVPLHHDLVNMIHDTTYKTAVGQQMDVLRGKEDLLTEEIAGLDYVSGMKMYKDNIQLKTGYAAIYLPVVLGLRLAGLTGVDNPDLYKEMGSMALEMGILVQLEDDFMDWTGPEANAETYADIRSGRSTWCYQQARRLCQGQREEEQILLEHYGRADKSCVEAVVALYEKLHLRQLFRELEREICVGIEASAKAIEEKYELSGVVQMISSVTKVLLTATRPGHETNYW